MIHWDSQAKGSVVIAIILLIGVNYWYYTLKLPVLDFSPKTPFAFVIQKNGDSLQRAGGQKYWQQLSLGQGLFESGELKTGNSKVLLGVTGGASLEMMPNTRLSFDTRNREVPSLSLFKGEIFIRSEKENKLLVSLTGESRYVYRYGDSNFSSNGSHVSIQVLSGKAIAQTRNDSHILNRGDSGRLTTTQFFLEDSKIQVIEPRDKEHHTLPPNRRMKVQWQSLGPSYNRIYFYGGSSPESLKPLPYRFGLDRQELYVQVQPDLLYWKLIASSPNKGFPRRESPTFFTRFSRLSPPVALAPNRSYVPVGKYRETKVQFIVENPANLSNLTIEISPSFNFHQKVQRAELGGRNEALIKVGAVGNLYWRVVGQSPIDKEVIEGPPAQFAILERVPSDMSWAREKGISVDWEVELEAQNGKVITHNLKVPYFTIDASKVPSDISAVRYRFAEAKKDILASPWIEPRQQQVRLPVSQSGFYYLQMIGQDSTRKQTRLIRNELIYLLIPHRDLAAAN